MRRLYLRCCFVRVWNYSDMHGSFDSISLRNYHSRWPWTGQFLIFRNRLKNDAADLFEPDLWYQLFFNLCPFQISFWLTRSVGRPFNLIFTAQRVRNTAGVSEIIFFTFSLPAASRPPPSRFSFFTHFYFYFISFYSYFTCTWDVLLRLKTRSIVHYIRWRCSIHFSLINV